MTEELKQKAEQFAEKHAFRVPYDGSNKFYNDTDYKASKDGYIAGATENGVVWHDLRKNPNDLPKKNKSYWVYIDCQGNKIYRSIVWQGCWLGWNCVPRAWCEEPQFKE